jgi:hypothetical protein
MPRIRRLIQALLVLAVPVATVGLSPTVSGAPILPPGGPIPFPTPIQLTPIPIRSYPLVSNGGFEQSSSWTRWEGARYADTPRHCGARSMALGEFGQTFIYQTVTIPTGTSPILSFWLRVDSTVMAPTADDTLTVSIHAPNSTLFPGTQLATVATFSNLDNTNGSFVRKGNYSLSPFAGQTIQLAFVVSAPGPAQGFTVFYLDDVSLWTGPHFEVPCN